MSAILYHKSGCKNKLKVKKAAQVLKRLASFSYEIYTIPTQNNGVLGSTLKFLRLPTLGYSQAFPLGYANSRVLGFKSKTSVNGAIRDSGTNTAII